jgi:hypothetical protein
VAPALAEGLQPGDGDRDRELVVSRALSRTMPGVLHADREGQALEARLAAAARLVADDAREHGLSAVRMLVALKRTWVELGAGGPSAVDTRVLFDRLVTLSIRAYYAAGPTPSADAPPGAGTRGRVEDC